jgi:hypothetical protein
MTDDIVFNSAIPQWSLAQSLGNLTEPRFNVFRDKSLDQDVNLQERLTNAHPWPVRNQFERGTCNAFAVVAAEELFRFIEGGETELEKFSEEHLYSKSRLKPFDRVPDPPQGDALTAIQALGGTFLGQVMDALIDDGLADAADAEYDSNAPVNFQVSVFKMRVEERAKQRRVEEKQLFHDITEAKVGVDREWVHGTRRANLVEFFANQLSKGFPVVASFAILNDAEYVWKDDYAQASGHIRYPTDEVAKGKRPVAGHSVCLVGYRPNLGADRSNPGTFLFRNSYGTEKFAKDPSKYPKHLNAGLPGYGIISAHDVSRYCWEILTRATDDDIQLLTDGDARRLDIR